MRYWMPIIHICTVSWYRIHCRLKIRCPSSGLKYALLDGRASWYNKTHPKPTLSKKNRSTKTAFARPTLTYFDFIDSNTMSCEDQIIQEINAFEAVAYTSFAVTFACVIMRKCYRESWQQNPEQGYKILFGFAAVKFLLGFLLITVFLPTCPANCDCGQYSPSITYPAIVFLLSIYWAVLAKKYLDLSRQRPYQGASPAGSEMGGLNPIA